MKFSELNNNQTYKPKVLNLDKCFAKVSISKSNKAILSTTVLQHCILVGFVAEKFIAKLPNEYWKSRLPRNVGFISAIHDIGKVSPSFQKKLRENCTRSVLNNNLSKIEEALIGFHTSTGEACLQNYNKTLASIVGQHHGYRNKNLSLPNSDKYGGHQWQEKREELIKELESLFPSNIYDIDNYDFDLILAFVVISDWIGSSITIPDNCTIEEMQLLADAAVTKINFKHDKVIENKSFEDIFGFEPRLFQNEFINMAKNNNNTYILEAPMGYGKTEAALYAAYKQLNKMNGLYYALPTRITSNFIYARVDNFLSNISPNYDIKLIHSGFNTNRLGSHNLPNEDWFSSKKKSLLAPYGVGTIDQALMSVLRVKHHELSKFGLSGKIVIFDEVHCFDVYTSSLLYELIRELEELGATIIILSATLTRKQIIRLLDSVESEIPKQIPYPCCMYKKNNRIACNSISQLDSKKVKIELLGTDADTISKTIIAATEGQQVLWIENTVKEAQSIFKRFKSLCKSDIEIGLIHSRFTSTHRALHENYWIKLYGKNSKKERLKKGRILVGTQILEQSLDIDADLLVTRLAPIDLIFQRMGRLWRHETLNSVRPITAKRKAIILITPNKNSKRFPLLKGATSYVYPRFILAKTLKILENTQSVISIPSDIRPLIESVYEDKQENNELAFYKQELDKKKEKLNSYALSSLNTYGQIISADSIPTRINDQIKTKILLIKSFKANEDNFTIYFLTGEKLELYSSNKTGKQNKGQKLLLLANQIVETNLILDRTKNTNLAKYISNEIYINNKFLNSFVIAKIDKQGSLKYLDGTLVGLNYSKTIGLYKDKEIAE